MSHERELIDEMKRVFGSDSKRIEHALNVTQYATFLLQEEAGDPEVVVPASILHDIGIHEAERKYGSTAGPYQEKEGPPIARGIMTRLGIDETIVEEVCTIIAHHHSPGTVDTINFKILYDADWLVNLQDDPRCQDRKKLPRLIGKLFFTDSAKRLAKKIYLNNVRKGGET